MQNTPQDNARVIAPPPLIYAASLLLGLYLHSKMPLPLLPFRRRGLLSTALMGGSLVLGLLAFRTMRGAGTSISPAQPVTALVVDGPFKISRNPIYLALTLFYTGISVSLNTLWTMLLLPLVLLVMNWGVIDREEQYLEHKFGEQYRQYKESVRRWL